MRVARSTAEAAAAVRRVRRAMATALPLAALCGAAGAFFVARRATRPIALLTQSARALAAAGKGALDAGATPGELRELARTLNEAFAQIAAAAERETRFAADAAHELRTPVAVLRMSLELALSRPREAAEYRATLEDALAACLRLHELSESLLLLHRAEHGAVAAERLDLRDVVREAIAESDAAARGPRISYEPPADSLPVDGRRALLGRVVGNLLQNARRHGGGTVRLSLREDGGCAALVAEDDGPGFPPELLPRLFERLARGDASRARTAGGAGLGLAILRAVAESHGGTALASNRPGGGARVEVRLPLAA
jgi:signal transduction histidine kinase